MTDQTMHPADPVGPPPGAPRWLKVSAIVAAAVIVLIVTVAILGGHSPGRHGPSRHTGGFDTPSARPAE